MFYDESGGGLTVSERRVYAHPAFVVELFELCRQEGTNTALRYADVDPEALLEVIPVTDHFLLI
jgi:pyruvate-formate lyase-activating enzyme